MSLWMHLMAGCGQRQKKRETISGCVQLTSQTSKKS